MERPPPANRFPTAPRSPRTAIYRWSGLLLFLALVFPLRSALEAAPDADVVPSRIGVLLPLTGRFAVPGNEVKKGLELALEALESSGSSPLTLVYRDTQDSAEQTATAVRELVRDEKVVAIIGPLVSATVDAAANAAAELQVPMLALTQKPEIPHLGRVVFRDFMTSEHQLRTLVGYMMEQLELRRFAIVHPEKRYGMELTGVFWDEVVRRGGQITGIESYAEGTTDFLNVARRVGGKFYVELRKSEQRRGEAEYQRALKEAGKKASRPYELPPIVDYDAVFVPDSPKTASLVASTMAYMDIPVGAFAVSREQTPVRMAGISAWNTPELVTHGGQYMENAVFVDNFFPASPAVKTRELVEAFQRKHNRAPDLLAATGYDALGLLNSLLKQGTTDRAGLIGRLKSMTGYEGATGTIAFDERGELKKELYVIGVFKKQLVQLSPVTEP